MEIFCIFGIVKKAVQVGVSVIEGREKEAQGRHIHDPVTDPLFDRIVSGIVAECCFGELHRTDAAEDILVNVSRSIVHIQTVPGFAWNVISGMNEKDQIILAEIIRRDHTVIEPGDEFLILQTGITELQKKFLGAAFQFLLKRKLHIQKILSDGAGKGLAENIKIFEHFFVRERKKCFFHLQLFFFFSVYITAADPCDGTAVRCKLFLDLSNFFFIHK